MRVRLLSILILLLVIVNIISAQDDTPEATETPIPPVTLTIWWPDSFARVNETEINPIFIEQSNAFLDDNPNILFDHRLKPVGQTGGIMSTLRSASNVARGALPTLTLIRRQDLLFAQASGYLRSLEGFPSTIQGDLNTTIQLGQVDDVLYGVPYLLELQHMVYRPSEDVNYDDWSFDAVLERNEAFAFPAGRINSLNDVLALQYIAGGAEFTADGFNLNQSALSTIFNFYEQATDAELITGATLNYPTSSNYLLDYNNGDIDTALFSSTTYLSMYANDNSLGMAPIPSETGDPISFMNGWMWVMITQNASEQAIALDYLSWMMNAERQSDVGQSVLMLPSRESALELGLANNMPTEPYIALLDNALMPLTDNEIGTVGRLIQTNFASILTLENSAEDAIQSIITSIGE